MMLVSVTLMAGVPAGVANADQSGPDQAKCSNPAPPPRDNPSAPADYCGVHSLDITRNNVLPPSPGIGKLIVDLYIEDDFFLVPQVGLVNFYGDNRDFLPKGAADPHADPSRSRVEGVFDFDTGSVTFHVNPSCSEAHEVTLFPPSVKVVKECHRPQDEEGGNNVDVTLQPDGSMKIETTFSESNILSVAGVCSIHNDFIIKRDPDSGAVSFAIHGSQFPSLAVIHKGRVVLADHGVNKLQSLCRPVGINSRDLTYTATPSTDSSIMAGAVPPPGPGSGWTLLGGAQYTDDGRLSVTQNGVGFEKSAAYWPAALRPGPMSIEFDETVTGPDPADGLAVDFLDANAAGGVPQLGGPGASLGFVPLTGRAAAIFENARPWSCYPSDHFTAVIDGSQPAGCPVHLLATGPAPTIVNQTHRVRVSVEPSSGGVRFMIEMDGLMSLDYTDPTPLPSSFFLGFSGGTGNGTETGIISNVSIAQGNANTGGGGLDSALARLRGLGANFGDSLPDDVFNSIVNSLLR